MKLLLDARRFGCRNWKGNSMHASLCRLVLSSSIYNICSFMNEIKHNGHSKIEEQLLKVIFLGSEVHNSKKREVSKVSSKCCRLSGLEH
jgi:hypothetical protein